MGGSLGNMMLRHANRMRGTFSSNDPRNRDATPRRKKHPDVIAASRELERIQMRYVDAKREAVCNFQRGLSVHGAEFQRAGLIKGDESIRDLIRISHEL